MQPLTTLLEYSLKAWLSDSETCIEDAYKWLFHATLGGEHAVRDESGPRSWLDDEWPTLTEPLPNEPSVVSLRPDRKIIRVNLRPYRSMGRDKEELLHVFVRSARAFRADRDEFIKEWNALGVFLQESQTWEKLTYDGWLRLDEETKAENYPAIDHSQHYLNACNPAYRVMLSELWQ
jgi:hypothetical protein